MNETETGHVFRCFDPLDAGRDTNTYRSQCPPTLEQLYSYSQLILGHFTSTAFLPSILAHGLQPDYDKQRVMDDNVPSDGESVYLCSRYDRLYIQRAVKHHGGSGIVIVVSVPVASLAADESALSLFQREQFSLDVQLFHSLCVGACKHPGTIPPSSFVGIFDTDGKLLQ